jgi:hypothetical protein
MKFQFTLTGISPLLMHADNVENSDMLAAWRKAPENKSLKVAGDDRSPPWSWQTYLITDNTNLCLSVDMLSAALRQAGSMLTLGKRGTMKSVSQSGLFLEPDFMSLTVGDKPISVQSINDIRDLTFAEQSAAVQDLGFSLFVKRATVGSAKHVRVRARFDEWQVSGTVETLMKELDETSVRDLFRLAGQYKGLGDWRPSAPKSPGRFGRFTAELKKIAA